MSIVDSVASNNLSFGVESVSQGRSAPATAVIAHSVITGNDFGVLTVIGGVINSYGDNDIDGNSDNNIGALTVIPTH